MIVKGAIFVLIGIIVGVVGTILFFRMDKQWKQILVFAGSALSVGGAGRVVIDYLEVSKEEKATVILILVIGFMISVFFSFFLLTRLLKEQTGNNVIRVLDIFLSYDGFLRDYYESRKKEIDKLIDSEEIKKKEEELKKELDVLKTEHQGSLLLITARGTRREIMEKIQAKNPHFCEVLPLTLEEIFISETEVAGYEIQNIFF